MSGDLKSGLKSTLDKVGVLLPVRSAYWRLRGWGRVTPVTDKEIFQTSLVPERQLKLKQAQALRFLLEGNYGHIGDYLEFGVYNGRSFACMYETLEQFKLHDVRLFGFDSFEGLPDAAATDDGGHWVPGAFCCPRSVTERMLDVRGVDRGRTELVEGWFDETLTDQNRSNLNIRKVGVAMVDCDMYTSTVPVLNFLEPVLSDRSVIIFDDWNSGNLAEKNLGQRRAWDEFLAVNPDIEVVQQVDGYNEYSTIFFIRRIA
ncbi:MAG: TylF/MycF/NovP-related O-methyltransferase [Pseudomonadota bacterium]